MKYEMAYLVLIYNKQVDQSETISSFLKANIIFDRCEIVIWNNGPDRIELDDSIRDKLSSKGFDVCFKQTINNISLSSIYNKFLLDSDANKYVILDDDSKLNDLFLLESFSAPVNALTLPLISSRDEFVSPKINGDYIMTRCTVSNEGQVEAIGSGMTIGSDLVRHLKGMYSNVFDERYFFYGVDTSFCLRFNRSCTNYIVNVVPGFEHSLSRLEEEPDDILRFRCKERAYDKGLTVRYYLPFYKSIFIFLKTIALSIFNKVLSRKRGKYDLWSFIKAYITGKHYRT